MKMKVKMKKWDTVDIIFGFIEYIAPTPSHNAKKKSDLEFCYG